MKINKVNKLKPLRDLVAFKWIKIDRIKTSNIVIPETIYKNEANARLGNYYTCEVLAIGPKVTSVKPGDYFMLHEYNKIDTATSWKDDEILFCEEKHISFLLMDKQGRVSWAPEITEKMEEEYENL
jgi:hypothetical protein